MASRHRRAGSPRPRPRADRSDRTPASATSARSSLPRAALPSEAPWARLLDGRCVTGAEREHVAKVRPRVRSAPVVGADLFGAATAEHRPEQLVAVRPEDDIGVVGTEPIALGRLD